MSEGIVDIRAITLGSSKRNWVSMRLAKPSEQYRVTFRRQQMIEAARRMTNFSKEIFAQLYSVTVQ